MVHVVDAFVLRSTEFEIKWFLVRLVSSSSEFKLKWMIWTLVEQNNLWSNSRSFRCQLSKLQEWSWKMFYHLLTTAIIGFANLEWYKLWFSCFNCQVMVFQLSCELEETWFDALSIFNWQVMIILPLFSCTVALTLEGPIWGMHLINQEQMTKKGSVNDKRRVRKSIS